MARDLCTYASVIFFQRGKESRTHLKNTNAPSLTTVEPKATATVEVVGIFGRMQAHCERSEQCEGVHMA